MQNGESRRGGWDRIPISRLVLAGIVVGTVLLRISLALTLPRTLRWDEPHYLLLARNLVTGQGYSSGIYPEVHFPPLQPLASGILYLLVGDLEKASNWSYALFGGLLLLPVFALARRIYGTHTAWLTTVLLAIFPALSISVLYWGTMTEPLYLCLIYSGLASLFVGLEDNRIGMFGAAGMFFGLAYLTRPEGFVYFSFFLMSGVLWLARRSNLRPVRPWRALGWFVLAFALLAAPYVWYLHAHTGKWMLSGKLGITWDLLHADHHNTTDKVDTGLDAAGREIMWYSQTRFERGFLERIWSNPKALARRIVDNMVHLPGLLFRDSIIFSYLLLPLVGIGLFSKPWDRVRLKHELFLVAAMIPVLAFLGLFIQESFLIPVFPVLLMWTARGAVELGIWLQDTVEQNGRRASRSLRVKTLLGWLPASLVILFLLMRMPMAARAGMHWTNFGHKQVGLWLRNHTPVGTKVMVRKVEIAFYADRTWIPSPNTDWVRFLEYARAHGADYLVVDDREPKVRPQLAFLLGEGQLPPELKLVFEFEERGQRTLVYRISYRKFGTGLRPSQRDDSVNQKNCSISSG